MDRATSLADMKTAKRTKFSIAGVCFAGFYGAVSAICVVLALSQADHKDRFVLLQLPIAVQMALLPENALRMLEGLSWTGFYLLIGLPTLLVFYLLGSALGYAASEK
jgi:hypothetical protein